MLSRREVLAGGLAGSLAGDVATTRQPDQEISEIADAIREVDQSIDQAFNNNSLAIGVVATLRKGFETFIKASGKFPDYCEVGLSVFYEVYDWHVRNRQPVVVVRQPENNRYTLQFMFTLLILKHESDVNYIGYPYDRA